MGWLIALGVLTLIAILPVGVSAIYNEEGPIVSIIVGPVHIPVFPAKKKEKPEKPKKTKAQTTTRPAAQKTQKKGGSIEDFLPIVDMVLDFLSAFRRKLRVKKLYLKLILGGSDPSDLAVNYGRGWAVLGNLMPLLDNAFVIKKRDAEVECDFLAEKTTIIARLDISITVGRVLSLAVVHGVPILRELLKVMNKRKGGAKA